MNKRYIGAVIYLVPTLLMIYLGGDVLKYGLLILSLLGLLEIYDSFDKKGLKPFKWVGFLSTIIYYFYLGTGKIDLVIVGFLMTLIMIILLAAPVFIKGRGVVDSACTFFGVFYVSGLMSLIFLISLKEYGNVLIWLIFISSWACDTAAYFIGKNFGKSKIAPTVSPNKTYLGSIAGLFASVLFCALYGFITQKYFGLPYAIYHFVIIGFLCGILNQIGDLTASFIKRDMGIKDFSNLIPGHGGILDRFDSIFFASVVIYYYISIVI